MLLNVAVEGKSSQKCILLFSKAMLKSPLLIYKYWTGWVHLDDECERWARTLAPSGEERSASPQWTHFSIRLQAPRRSRPTRHRASEDDWMQTFLYQSDVRSWISSSIASCSVLSWSRTCRRPTSSELSSNVKKHQIGGLWETPEKNYRSDIQISGRLKCFWYFHSKNSNFCPMICLFTCCKWLLTM